MPPFVARLRRYFTLANLAGLLLTVAALTLLQRQIATEALVAHEERANTQIADMLARSLWARYAGFVARSAAMTDAELLARRELDELRGEISRLVAGSPVLKVKLYDPNGRVVFSTERLQIGEDKRDNSGFQQAIAGKPASAVTFRDTFNAFESEVTDRSLVASYVPVHGADGTVTAVLELYSDVTPLLARLERTHQTTLIGTLSIIAALYALLYLIGRRAERLFRHHEAHRDATHATVRHRAYHDILTELPNRASFEAELAGAVARAEAANAAIALLFIDVDDFKAINDRYGHQAGDGVLQQIAERLRLCVRESDSLFRVGGDEFTVLLEDFHSVSDPGMVVRRIQHALSRPVTAGNIALTVTLSIGVAVAGDNGGSNYARLFNDADAAMYCAKHGGKNRSEIYAPGVQCCPGGPPPGLRFSK